MPQIETWSRLPAAIRDHLIDRMRDRKISVNELNQLRFVDRVEAGCSRGAVVQGFWLLQALRRGKISENVSADRPICGRAEAVTCHARAGDGGSGRRQKYEGQAKRTCRDWPVVHHDLDGRAVPRLPTRTFLNDTPETGFIPHLALPLLPRQKNSLPFKPLRHTEDHYARCQRSRITAQLESAG
jgi:hypothetical protein